MWVFTCAGGKGGISGWEKSSNNSFEDNDCRNGAPSWGNTPWREASAGEDSKLALRGLRARASQWESCKWKKLHVIYDETWCLSHKWAKITHRAGTPLLLLFKRKWKYVIKNDQVIFSLSCIIAGQYGSAVVSIVTSQQKGSGFECAANWGISVWNLYDFSGHPGFLPQLKEL